MAYRYKRFYLSGVVSILLIFGMIAQYVEYYDNYEEVVICGEECWATFCMKNKGKNLYFYNKEELPLTFEPASNVHKVEFYKKDGRYKTGYRPIDFIAPYSKDRKYVFKIPAYSYTCYGMKIYKDYSATVKWTFLGLDPILQAPDGNLSYVLNEVLNDSLEQNFMPNWSIVPTLINFSDNYTIQSGNFSWNFTEFNISANITDWVYNITNIGSTNFTVLVKINGSYDGSLLEVWFWNNATQRFNISNETFTALFNLTVNETKFINVTIDLINISQTYVNWTLTNDNSNYSFRVEFNVTLI